MNTIKTEFNRTFNVTKWVFSIYFKNYPVLISIYIIIELILSLANLFNAYIFAVVTDMAIKLTQSESVNVIDFYQIILLTVGTYLLTQILTIASRQIWRIISYQDGLNLRKMLNQRLSELGIQNLENPEVTNKSQRFAEEMGNISGNLEISINILTNIVALVSSALVLANTIPSIMYIFTLVVIFQFISNQKFIRLLWIFNRDATEERRKNNTSLNLMSEPAALKELILSDGNYFLEERVNKYIDWVVNEVVKIRKKWATWQVINKIIDSAAFGYGLVIILSRLVQKMITIGQLTFEIRSLRIFADSFNNLTGNIVGLRENTIRIGDIQELFNKYLPEVDGQKVLNLQAVDIRFDNIDFKYPNSDKKVFNNLNLEIKNGEKVAIVGENGAGKTTLVKLICRIYKANNGSVLLNDININNIKISSWYKKLAILFQDYTMYTHLTVRENIEVDSNNNITTDDSLRDALKKANAYDFVMKYKNKMDQILSERYKGGIRPSTGQWQKIAIARVFHRNAPILILDEPTASIDAVAEAKIFDNIYKFSKGKTVIIISHRFSTVRNADRIIVLDKGKIIEQGSHEELLKKDGKYARAFKLQAKGYQ